MNGGERVAEVLRAQGVDFLFTLSGGHIAPILVESKRIGIRVVDVRHEVNAVFAADAVGRLTGQPGVAVVTAGPGVTNSITAIKNAQMAQSPLVLLGGATATILRGRGSLQDIDQMAAIRPHVKYAARPNSLKEVVPALNKAFEVARSGVPGPVFVELAMNLLYDEKFAYEAAKESTQSENKTIKDLAVDLYVKGHMAYVFGEIRKPNISKPSKLIRRAPEQKKTRRAVRLLGKAKRPVLVIGSQTMLHPEDSKELVAAIERIGIPVYLSGMARGLLGVNHPLQMRHKRKQALRQADLVLLCGTPADFRLEYGLPLINKKVITANLARKDLRKNLLPQLAVLADPHTFLVKVADKIGPRTKDRSSWIKQLRDRDDDRNRQIMAMSKEKTDMVNPLRLCQAIDEKLSENSLVIGDGGDFIGTAAYVLQPRAPYSWLDPGVFGTLGVGAGFAIGAKLVHPEADVWLLYGDGAAGFSLMEFDTFVRHGLSIIAVIGNDAGWTQIEREQVEMLGDDVACRLNYTDYQIVAEGCGGKGIKVDKPDKVKAALKDALETSRKGTPVLVNAHIGKTDFRKGSISV